MTMRTPPRRRPAPEEAATARLAQALLSPPAPFEGATATEWIASRAVANAAGPLPAGRAPLDRALLASTRADRLAWAFLEAYQAAIRGRFAPDAPDGALGSFLANESGRRMVEIDTRLTRDGDALRLDGAKSWCLRAADPFDLYVLARAAEGPPSGPGSLVVVAVRSDAPGVSLAPGLAQRVVPELPHASARFDAVAIAPDDLLPGDGYGDYARPFRLDEDRALAACTLAWLLGEAARRDWPDAWRQRALAAVVMLRNACGPDAAPQTELLAAGAVQLAGGLLDEADAHWAAAPGDDAGLARWRRDRALLDGGRGVREARARSAWQALRRPAGSAPDARGTSRD